MYVKDAVVQRIESLCKERGIAYNALAVSAGVTPSTVYSLLSETRRDVSLVTLKKLCDGFGITLGEFFSTPEFDALEQEIRLARRKALTACFVFFSHGGAPIAVR